MQCETQGQRRKWPYPLHSHYRSGLNRAAARWFADKGFSVSNKYPFILASRDDWQQNIIVPEVASYIAKEKAQRQSNGEPFPLHKYIHHGLSSQAMLFNLVGPLMVRDDLSPLRNALDHCGVPWPEGDVAAKLEVEDREVFGETQAQPTSLDMAIVSQDGASSVFVEAKLVEQEFGGCSVFQRGDCDGRSPSSDPGMCYLHHRGRTYWDRLEEFGFLDGPIKEGPVCVLASHYQFFREVLFALAKGGSFVLLLDERSPTFCCDGEPGQRGLMPFMLSLVPSELRSRVGMVTIQNVVQAIREAGRHGDWIGEFERKYGLEDGS